MNRTQGSVFNRIASAALRDVAAIALRGSLSYRPQEAALLLVGVQPDLLKNAGVADHLEALLVHVRANGNRVIYAPAACPTPENGVRNPTPSQRALLVEGALRPGSVGAAFHPQLAPRTEDIVQQPHAGLSAFTATGLAQRLQALNIPRLIVAGARSDIEIDSTARDAVEHGFQTTVVSDCCEGTTPADHRATMTVTLPRVVHGVLNLNDLVKRLDA